MASDRRLQAVVAFVALLAPGSAIPAQCEPENQVGNCGFEIDTAGWFADFTDSFARTTVEAHGGLASGEAGALLLTNEYAALIRTCVSLLAGLRHELTGYFKLASGAGVECHLELGYIPADFCADLPQEYSNTDPIPVDALDWGQAAGIVIPPVWAASAIFLPTCLNDQDFVVRLDDFAVRILDTVFADGFESGDTSAWDFVLPEPGDL